MEQQIESIRKKLLIEKSELETKLDKLAYFLEEPHVILEFQKHLLTLQLQAMKTYHACLVIRLNYLDPKYIIDQSSIPIVG